MCVSFCLKVSVSYFANKLVRRGVMEVGALRFRLALMMLVRQRSGDRAKS